MSRRITKELKDHGVLYDPTTITLGDADSDAYGVRRTDTEAVVVAAGTAMEKVSTGVYTYVFDEPEYGLTYEYIVYQVYDGNAYSDDDTIAGTAAALTGTETLDNMLSDLSIYLNLKDMERKGRGIFDPSQAFLVRLLNKAQDMLIPLLKRSVLSTLDVTVEGCTVDADGMYDLTTLTQPIFQINKGIDSIRIADDGEYIKLVSAAEMHEMRHQGVVFSVSDPIYHKRGSQIFIEPLLGADGSALEFDINYMRPPVAMALGATAATNTDCELSKQLADIILELAAYRGFLMDNQANRAATAIATANEWIKQINDRYPDTDSLLSGKYRDYGYNWPGGSHGNIYNLGM